MSNNSQTLRRKNKNKNKNGKQQQQQQKPEQLMAAPKLTQFAACAKHEMTYVISTDIGNFPGTDLMATSHNVNLITKHFYSLV